MTDIIEKSKKEDWQKKAEEYLQGWKRERAEFLNYKKDIQKEKEFANERMIEDIVRHILPFLDNLDAAAKSGEEWVKGLKKELLAVFERYELQVIGIPGEEFNPEIHETVGEAEGEEGKVSEVVQKGYQLKGKVIRPARVKIGVSKHQKSNIKNQNAM